MNRIEALHALGLDESATTDDVRIAYKETVQILHPDRFTGKSKLQERATEQFKHMQEAYEYLCKNPPEKAKGTEPASRGARARQIRAKLAGIQAARTQLVAQKDTLLDSRKMGIALMVGGLAGAVLLRRIPLLAAVATACIVWGIVQTLSNYGNLKVIQDHLDALKRERKKLEAELEELD